VKAVSFQKRLSSFLLLLIVKVLKHVVISIFGLTILYSCDSGSLKNKYKVNNDFINLEKYKFVVKEEVCDLDFGQPILKKDIIGKYNLNYAYGKTDSCYQQCSLIETKEGLDFLDSNTYEFVTFTLDSNIYVGKGHYKLDRENLTLNYYQSRDSIQIISEKYKLTGKNNMIYFRKLNLTKTDLIYEYEKIE